jgi:hypothetical protein
MMVLMKDFAVVRNYSELIFIVFQCVVVMVFFFQMKVIVND